MVSEIDAMVKLEGCTDSDNGIIIKLSNILEGDIFYLFKLNNSLLKLPYIVEVIRYPNSDVHQSSIYEDLINLKKLEDNIKNYILAIKLKFKSAWINLDDHSIKFSNEGFFIISTPEDSLKNVHEQGESSIFAFPPTITETPLNNDEPLQIVESKTPGIEASNSSSVNNSSKEDAQSDVTQDKMSLSEGNESSRGKKRPSSGESSYFKKIKNGYDQFLEYDNETSIENLSDELKSWITKNKFFSDRYEILYTTTSSDKDSENKSIIIRFYNKLLLNMTDSQTILFVNKELANSPEHYAKNPRITSILIMVLTRIEGNSFLLNIYKKIKPNKYYILAKSIIGEFQFKYKVIRGKDYLAIQQKKSNFNYNIDSYYVIGELSLKEKQDLWLRKKLVEIKTPGIEASNSSSVNNFSKEDTQSDVTQDKMSLSGDNEPLRGKKRPSSGESSGYKKIKNGYAQFLEYDNETSIENLSDELKSWITKNKFFSDRYEILYTTTSSDKDSENKSIIIRFYNKLLLNMTDSQTILFVNKELANSPEHYAKNPRITSILIMVLTRIEGNSFLLNIYKKIKPNKYYILAKSIIGEFQFKYKVIRGKDYLAIQQKKSNFNYNIDSYYVIGELSLKEKQDLWLRKMNDAMDLLPKPR